MRADPTCRVRNTTPKYPAYYESPDREPKPGSLEWEYWHATKRYGHLAVGTGCEPENNRFVFYRDDGDHRLYEAFAKRTGDPLKRAQWEFSDPDDVRFGHPKGTSFVLEILSSSWMTPSQGGLEGAGKRGGLDG